jgi:hypothetical protein
MTDERVVRSRLLMLPPIRRARLWRLYAEGRRFLDMWMDGGRAMLGAKGSGIGTAAKAAIDMGLLRPMPSAWERRLARQLALAHPGFAAARFFLDDARALAAAERALGAADPAAVARSEILDPARRAGIRDPARRESTAAGSGSAAGPAAAGPASAIAVEAGVAAIEILRPFAESLPGARSEAPSGVAPFAMPLVPCPSALAPSILLFRSGETAGRVEGDILPPVRLAAAHRALCELARMSEWYGEDVWKKADRRLKARFERLGPYLYPRAGAERYGELFEAALSAGVLLSPDPELPSIVPGDFDDGELAALAAALAAM